MSCSYKTIAMSRGPTEQTTVLQLTCGRNRGIVLTMSFTATVEHNMIKLPPGMHLPDGTQVSVELQGEGRREVPVQTFAERYAEFIGIWKDGPTDLAENHDHYASGARKRTP